MLTIQLIQIVFKEDEIKSERNKRYPRFASAWRNPGSQELVEWIVKSDSKSTNDIGLLED